MTPWGQAPTDPSRSGTELGAQTEDTDSLVLSWGASLPQAQACGRRPAGDPTPQTAPDISGKQQLSAGIFPLSRSPSPPPPQSGCSCQDRRLEVQVGRWPAAHLPPVSVCERGSRPTSGILHSLLVLPLPPVPWEPGVSRPRSSALFSPAPLRLQCRQCSLGSPARSCSLSPSTAQPS